MRAGLVAVLLLSACVAPENEQFRCDRGDCPSGFSCAPNRLCYRDGEGPDSGLSDASVMDAGRDGPVDSGGADGGPSDAGPLDAAPLDAGPCGTDGDDADGDGVCTNDSPADCDDTNPLTFPGAEECSDGGRDNDCDGLVDEACDWGTSSVHLPLHLHRASTGNFSPTSPHRASHFLPELSGDGTRLYFVSNGFSDNRLYVAERARTSDGFGPFAAPEEVPFDMPRAFPVAATLTGDQLEVVLSDTGGVVALWTATRTDSNDQFTEPTQLVLDPPPVSATTASFSRDGLELVVGDVGAANAGVWHYRRSVRAEPWVGGRIVTTPDGVETAPRFSADGLTVYFRTFGPAIRLVQLTRSSRSADFIGEPEEVPTALTDLVGVDGYPPFIHPEAREVWFTREPIRFDEANRLNSAMVRARLCRTASCSDVPGVSCAGGQPTADRLHCFRSVGDPITVPLGESLATALALRCAGVGAHLPTVASPDETAAVTALGLASDFDVLLGIERTSASAPWALANGEPFLGIHADAIPVDEATRGFFLDRGDPDGVWRSHTGTCLESGGCLLPAVCETDHWPTWPAFSPPTP